MKTILLADGSVWQKGAVKTSRSSSLAELNALGSNRQNFVSVFSKESDLPTYLANRIDATVMKRPLLFSQLYAENRESF